MALRRPVNKVEKSMREMQHGTLHSGSAAGPLVTNPKQAIAIGLSEARAKTAAAGTPTRRPFKKLS